MYVVGFLVYTLVEQCVNTVYIMCRYMCDLTLNIKGYIRGGKKIENDDANVEEKLLKVPGRLACKNLTIDDYSVIISIFRADGVKNNDHSSGENDAIRVNAHCPKLGQSKDVIVTRDEQLKLLGLCPLDMNGGGRTIGLQRLISLILFSVKEDPDDEHLPVVQRRHNLIIDNDRNLCKGGQ